MTIAYVILLVVHGAIHLMGFVKAFGLGELAALSQPISRPMGVLWLVASLLLLAAAVALFAMPRWWWLIGASAALLSQSVIVSAWSDAKFGTAANVLVIAGLVLGFLLTGPTSLRAEYDDLVANGLARAAASPLVSRADLAPLPPQLQRYLERVGVIGQPRAHNYRVTFAGRIRSGPDAPWMQLDAEQHSFTDPPTRLFYLSASRAGIPAVGLHRYTSDGASMRVKILGWMKAADASGPTMTRAETVTLFNDMCVMAPMTLLGAPVVWEVIDARHVRGVFTNAGQTISATLVFDDSFDLVDFWSDDRPAANPDGEHFTPGRWTTPLRDYKNFGPFRLASKAETRYPNPGGGDYAYGEFELTGISFNVERRR